MDEVNCYFELGFPLNKQECQMMNAKKLKEYDEREESRKQKLADIEKEIDEEEKYGIPLINYYDNAVDKR